LYGVMSYGLHGGISAGDSIAFTVTVVFFKIRRI
jgi:hypothetical protein